MRISRSLRAAATLLLLPCLAQAEGLTATPLIDAAYADDTAAAVSLLAEGADANQRNRYGVAPLSVACRNGNAELVDALLAAGADPNFALEGGETPLMTAARTGRLEPVVALLTAGARLDATNRKGQSALMWAANEGHAEVVDHFLQAGADPSAALKSGLTPMLLAARNGHLAVVETLLAAGIDIDEAIGPGAGGGKLPPKGTTALRIAVENGHFDLAVVLLGAGADPDDQRSGDAPLHVLTTVRKPNRGDGDGHPPPHGSGQLDSLGFARVLVEDFDADPNLRRRHGDSGGPKFGTRGATPFLLACRTADLPYLRLLKELGADPAITNDDGTTALMAVCGVGSRTPEEEAGTEPEALEVAAWLLEGFENPVAEVNAVNRNGETTLHGAAYRNWPEMVELLVDHGADITIWNQPNKHKWTPLLIARGYRPGNFKPSAETAEAIMTAMRTAGVEPPPHPPLPTTDKPKKYEP